MEPHPPGPRHVPFDGRPPTISMGLRPLGDLPWLEVDAHRDEELAEKARLLATRPREVVATLPAGDAGAAETLELVLAENRGRGIAHPVGTGEAFLRELHPIDAAGRIAQEDFCVMVREEGRWILASASVCAPSQWRLADKIGRDITAIHDPVPDYERIRTPVERFFDRIVVDRPVWRTNWTLLGDPTRFQPEPQADAVGGEVDAAAVVLRVERQTLRLLPRSGAVLFTIRTFVDRLDTLPPAARADLAATLAGADDDLIAYRGWERVLPAVLTWLTDGADAEG